MTCVVAIVGNDRVWMGADSAGISGWSLMSRADAKVFTQEPFIIGFTDSFRMGQLLRYKLSIEPPTTVEDLHRYMATTFVDAVRETLRDGGYAKKENEVERGGEFMVGVRGRLFVICSDYQVAEARFPYWAIGCGAELALGSLHATGSVAINIEPEDRIKLALFAAEEFSAGVRGPYTFRVL